MAIRQVTSNGIKQASNAGSFKKTGPFTQDFKILALKPGATYKIRVLPPNNDEKTYTENYDGFAVAFPSHYGVGDNAKEFCLCPNRVAPRYRVKCPMCVEYSEGKSTGRSKLNFYYYMNVVLLSKHEGIERTDAEGKLIVYTVRIPKPTFFDVLAAYCDNPDRAVADPFSIDKGCAISVTVTEKKAGEKKFPNYQIQFNEASVGDLTPKIRESDIKELRHIYRFIPTNAAMRNIADGMPIAEAMDVFGKIDIVTGKQIGGTKEEEKPAEAPKAAIVDDLDDLADFGDAPAKAPVKAVPVVDVTDDLDDLVVDSDDLGNDDEMPL